MVKKYSEFINFPIYLRTEKEVSKEVPDEEAGEQQTEAKEAVEQAEAGEKKDDLEVKDGEEEKEAQNEDCH